MEKQQLMKPNLKKQIESSQKGIDYVDSIKANEIGLSWEIAQRAMKNNIPETIAKLNRKKESRFVIFIWTMVLMGVVLWTLGIIYLIKR